MVIAEQITTQMTEFAVMFACGLAVAILFEIYNKNAGGFLGDIIFMTFAGFLISAFWYRSSFVRISVHETAALLLGILVWEKFLNGQISNFIGHIYVIMIVIVYMYYL